MSQEQPRRPQEPIKYGDVFQVSGELADKPIAPQDAALMQAAATLNERAGLVGHHDVMDFDAKEGVTVAEIDLPGTRIITESVAGQVEGQYVKGKPMPAAGDVRQAKVTIGEALEASARTAGDKSVDHNDAAAIMAAECRATGSNLISPGGLAATAQSAAAFNDGLIGDQGKVKLADVLTGARAKLPSDKEATREDAEGIMAAELRNYPNLTVHSGGVAATVAEAVRMNEKGST